MCRSARYLTAPWCLSAALLQPAETIATDICTSSKEISCRLLALLDGVDALKLKPRLLIFGSGILRDSSNAQGFSMVSMPNVEVTSAGGSLVDDERSIRHSGLS